MTTNKEKIADLERLRDHLERFTTDQNYRDELGRGFKGFSLSPDDILALEAVTAYHATLTSAPGRA
jgi:hypothetical protein